MSEQPQETTEALLALTGYKYRAEESAIPKVYAAIAAVQKAVAKEGISKDRKNEQQGYRFRGIDDIYNAIAPLLASNGLCIMPAYSNRTKEERLTAKGNTLFYVTVEGIFDFVSTVDGSKHVVRTFGEAMDSADKATNKAMSAAYKYACIQTFCIPTEGDNDADGTTHDIVLNAPGPVASPPPSSQSTPVKPSPAAIQTPTDRPKLRMATLNKLLAAPGQSNRTVVHLFLIAKGWITKEQAPENWPVMFLPKSPEDLKKLHEDVQAFEMQMREQPETVNEEHAAP